MMSQPLSPKSSVRSQQRASRVMCENPIASSMALAREDVTRLGPCLTLYSVELLL
jgi:hypothetical protein